MPEADLILIVEDREDDILLMQCAFEKASIKNPVQFVRTGEDLINYLSGEGQFSGRTRFPLPALVLLDLKLPDVNGFEVLSWIRQHHRFRTLPVIVLTSWAQRDFVNLAYRLGANSFFVKDTDFQKTVALCSHLQQYWLQTPQTAPVPETSPYPCMAALEDLQPSQLPL
jgi:CheY-like chemotaxis protein